MHIAYMYVLAEKLYIYIRTYAELLLISQVSKWVQIGSQSGLQITKVGRVGYMSLPVIIGVADSNRSGIWIIIRDSRLIS